MSKEINSINEVAQRQYKEMDKTWNETWFENHSSPVEHQRYYKRNNIEVIDVIKSVYQFFGDDISSFEASCIYNILKYLMRYKYKGNALQDLDKVIVNVNWLKDEEKNNIKWE